jgi:hypothetical protein
LIFRSSHQHTQHLFVEVEIGHQCLQMPVLIVENSQALTLTHFHLALALPDVDRHFADSVVPGQIHHLLCRFVLLKNTDNLLFFETAFLH